MTCYNYLKHMVSLYFKNPDDMYEMMIQEIKSLYSYQLLTKDEYLNCILIINQRRNEK